MTVRKHVPPHFLTPGAKRRVALAVVFGAEVVLGLIAVSAFLPARSAVGAASAASPQAGSSAASYTAAHSGYAATAAHSSEAASTSYTAARTVQSGAATLRNATSQSSITIARNKAIAKLAACETDTECDAAEAALRAAGCRFAAEGSSTILCPVDRGAVETQSLPLISASSEAAQPALAFYTTEHGKDACLADAEALPGGQVCIADYEGVR